MRIFIYGLKDDYNGCVACLEEVNGLQYRLIEYTHADDYDDYIKRLTACDAQDLIIVIFDGAEGMEAVMASKRVWPDTPVIWISDDSNFGIQSYRIGCTFFGVKPVNKEMMAEAIQRYNKERLD